MRLRRQALVGWLFALPFLVLFLTFEAGPVLVSLVMSLTDMRSTDLRNPLAVDFAGLANYAQIFTDEIFGQAAVNTVYYTFVGVPLTMVLGLGVAVLLNAGVNRLRAVFRVGFYLPVVASVIAVAVVWRFLLEDTGLVNRVLAVFGVEGPNWLNDPAWAMPALIVMSAWRHMGFLMVIFLAGLQAIPVGLYEAAKIDGATSWQRFVHITMPMLRPTLLFGAVVSGIGYLQLFEEPFVMTQGGPLNKTTSVALHIYHQFGAGNYGYAAALSYVLFIAIVALTAVQFRLLRSKV